MHRFLLHNDKILDAHEKSLSAGQTGLLNGWGVFSTIRVADGVLFAYERHFERMRHDAARIRVPFPADAEALKSQLLRLVEANSAWNATLRVTVIRNRGGMFEGPDQERDFDVVAFTKDLSAWGSSVRLAMKPNGRHAQSEFAGAKILSWCHNLTWYEEAHERGFDEVVLLNERGEVSECTSANLFVANGGEVATPPLSAGCLPGVTRELLLNEIRVPGITVVERTLKPADLERADQVFITSTTRDLLPAVEIEGLRVENRGTVVDELVKAMEDYRRAYVTQNAATVLSRPR
ncbi:MAG TPA: aminotransferase class IV [Bryobacteraceae bacterium]|nr:aminotransferase class IV [Bryobacteraceae bacterium]